jgi:hypothetical protein
LSHRFNANPLEIPADFFVAIVQIMLKFVCKGKGTAITQTVFKKNKVGNSSLNFETYINLQYLRVYSIE